MGGAIFSMTEKMLNKWLHISNSRTSLSGRACLVGFSGTDRFDLIRELDSIGIDCVISLPDGESLRIMNDLAIDFDVALVLLDTFESVEGVIDILILFRTTAPDCRIILVSKEAQVDDFGDERKLICDATLCWPISHRRLKSALEQITQ
jgi:hypothetical protein